MEMPAGLQGIDGYIYSPPAWRVCEECKGKGHNGIRYSVGQSIDEKYNTFLACENCNGTGRISLFYTPEQWQEAGGVLSDDTPVWVHVESWNMDEWQLIEYNKTFNTMFDVVIATEAGVPPEGYTP
jgi:hypothetical protein